MNTVNLNQNSLFLLGNSMYPATVVSNQRMDSEARQQGNTGGIQRKVNKWREDRIAG